MKDFKVSTLVWVITLVITVIFVTIKFYALEECETDGECEQKFEDLKTSIEILCIITTVVVVYVITLLSLKK